MNVNQRLSFTHQTLFFFFFFVLQQQRNNPLTRRLEQIAVMSGGATVTLAVIIAGVCQLLANFKQACQMKARLCAQNNRTKGLLEGERVSFCRMLPKDAALVLMFMLASTLPASGAAISSFIEFRFLRNEERSVTAFTGLFVNSWTLMCPSRECVPAGSRVSQSKEPRRCKCTFLMICVHAGEKSNRALAALQTL